MEQQFAHPAPRSVEGLRQYLDAQNAPASFNASPDVASESPMDAIRRQIKEGQAASATSNPNTAPSSSAAPENASTITALEHGEVNAIANLSLDDIESLRARIATLDEGKRHAEVVTSVNTLLPNLSDQDQGYNARFRHRHELAKALELKDEKFETQAVKWVKREHRERDLPMPTAAETDSLRQMAKERGTDVAKKVAKHGANAAKKVAKAGANVAERTKARATSASETLAANVTAKQEQITARTRNAEVRVFGGSYNGLVGRLGQDWDGDQLATLDTYYDARIDHAKSQGGNPNEPHMFTETIRKIANDEGIINKHLEGKSFETDDAREEFIEQYKKDISQYLGLESSNREKVQEFLGRYQELKAELPEPVTEGKERLKTRLQNRAKKIGAVALAFITVPGESMAFLADDTINAAGKLRERLSKLRSRETDDDDTTNSERMSLSDRYWKIRANREAGRIVKQQAEADRLAAMTDEERAREAQERKENRRTYRKLLIGAGALAAATAVAYLATRHGHHVGDFIPGGNGGHDQTALGPNEPGVNGSSLSLHEQHTNHVDHLNHLNHTNNANHVDSTSVSDYLTGHEVTTHFNNKGVEAFKEWANGYKVKSGDSIWDISKAFEQHLGHTPDKFTTDAIKDQLIPVFQHAGYADADGKLKQAGAILNFK